MEMGHWDRMMIERGDLEQEDEDGKADIRTE